MLNPGLYHALARRFGEVRISNEDMQRIETRWYDAASGEWTRVRIQGGEQYRVCCPFCGDTGFRLYVNYLWGARDPATGRERYDLVHCFNETHCMDDERNREKFINMVRYDSVIARPQETDVSDVYVPVSWPGEVIPVHKLYAAHPAKQYLLSRRFDPDYVGQFWDVRYCVRAAEYPNVSGALIIPIKHKGVMVGWQARAVGFGKENRYYTMPGTPRRAVLYGYDQAEPYGYCVVVEGPTDVWRLGPPAVGLLGLSVTSKQIDLLAARWADRPALFVPDPGEYDSYDADRTFTMMRRSLRYAVKVRLPDTRDPGDMQTEEVWYHIYAAAQEAGIPLEVFE